MDYITSIPQTLRKFRKGGDWEFQPRGYFFLSLHFIALHGLYSFLTFQIPWQQVLFAGCLIPFAGIGVSAGAHRLFAHKSYKARTPLRILLMIMQTMAGQSSLYAWGKHHRLHHKFCETDGDPVNVKRGFFFTHLGWVLIKEHPLVAEKERTIDCSDLESDPVVMFQDKYFKQLSFLFLFVIPTLIPYYLWLPSLGLCFTFNVFRYILSFHLSSMGNSVAHTWTRKPYDKSMGSADCDWLSIFILGEGWHNYHHVFPWDYRSTDYGLKLINPTTAFIEFMSYFGQAYDLKLVSDALIRKRAARTGDGTHAQCVGYQVPASESSVPPKEKKLEPCESCPVLEPQEETKKTPYDSMDTTNQILQEVQDLDNFLVGHDIGPGPWGWGDEDIPDEDVQLTKIEQGFFQKKFEASWRDLKDRKHH